MLAMLAGIQFVFPCYPSLECLFTSFLSWNDLKWSPFFSRFGFLVLGLASHLSMRRFMITYHITIPTKKEDEEATFTTYLYTRTWDL